MGKEELACERLEMPWWGAPVAALWQGWQERAAGFERQVLEERDAAAVASLGRRAVGLLAGRGGSPWRTLFQFS